MIWTRHRLELRNYWLNTSKLQSCWASLIGRPSVCKWGVCGDSSLLLCVTDGHGVCEYTVGLRLVCAGGHLGSNQVLRTPELSFTSFQPSLLLMEGGGGWGGLRVMTVQCWTFASPSFPLLHALIFSFSLLLCWERERERDRAHWPSKTPIGTKDRKLESATEGGRPKKLKLDNRKSLCENQWSTQMIVTRKMTWPPPFLSMGLIKPHTQMTPATTRRWGGKL